MAENIPSTFSSAGSDSSESVNEEHVEAPFSNPRGRTMGDGCNYAYEVSPDDDGDIPPPARHSHSRDRRNIVEVGRAHSRNTEAPFPRVPEGLFTRRTMADGCNYAVSPHDLPPPARHSHSRDRRNIVEAGRVHSGAEASAIAEFMAVSKPPMYQRSISDGFYLEGEDDEKRTYILMSQLSSEDKRRAASASFLDESTLEMEDAEAIMLGATGGAGEVISRREFAPNRYGASRTSNPRISSQSRSSGSRDSVDPSSVRTSTLSNATTVSDEQRRNRVTITPLLDEYYRNRASAIVANNPPAAESDRDILVDNDADGGSQNPSENPQEEGAAAPENNGWMEMYYKITRLVINSPFMLIIYLPLALWSIFCIFGGLKYMKRCPATDTLPMIFVFLGLTSLFTCITRMLHIVLHKLAAYPSIATVVQCLQTAMFLGYFFIYILELASFFLLDLKSLPEQCATEYYNFTHWNTWFQLPVLIIMIILHAPSAYRSKWYCGRAARS